MSPLGATAAGAFLAAMEDWADELPGFVDYTFAPGRTLRVSKAEGEYLYFIKGSGTPLPRIAALMALMGFDPEPLTPALPALHAAYQKAQEARI